MDRTLFWMIGAQDTSYIKCLADYHHWGLGTTFFWDDEGYELEFHFLCLQVWIGGRNQPHGT